MTTIKSSINIWNSTPLTGGPKDLNHAMALILKAKILAVTQLKYRESIKVYHKAGIIVGEITGTKMNTDTLLNSITGEVEQIMKIYEH